MNKKYYYASSNSMTGFQSYFDKIYDSDVMDKIYILKGTPGSGKSTALRKISEEFGNTENCEYFLCSSDPTSLDGIIINNKIAVIDGTSPHNFDPKYPGVVEHIIDNANGIDEKIYSENLEIKNLVKEKSKLYNSAYSFLKSCGEVKKERINCIRSITDINKLESAIERYFRQSFKKSENYSQSIRLIEGITPLGVIKTDGFENSSKNSAVITNGKGCEEIVYDIFLQKAKEYGCGVTLSYDPLLPNSINAILLNNQSVCIVNYNKKEHGTLDYDKYKVFNLERFLDANKIRKIKYKLKFSTKCENELMNEAIKYLKEASAVHTEIENVYRKYIDFSKVDKNTEYIIEKINHRIQR